MDLNYTVSLQLKETNPILNRSISDTKDISAYSEQSIVVASGATDTAISLGNLTTISTLYLETDREISVKFNGTGNPAYTVKDIIFLNTSGITSIYASNANAQDVNVKVFLA